MDDGDIPRRTRTAGIAFAVAALLAAVYAVVTQLTGPVVFEEGEREISVTSGTRFSIRLKDNPASGFRWVLAAPRPDPAVLQGAVGHYDADEPARAGSGGFRYVDFTARGTGHTEVTLRYCYRCGTPQALRRFHGPRDRTYRGDAQVLLPLRHPAGRRAGRERPDTTVPRDRGLT
ncbi:protease inhibitor I42 family protein [Streptomyces rimosus]|uniref:protease inhibitor I42 family protein n=1 Tax=Streptomyces rimosus TaxID=1927 RepID=UPI00102212EE|nr:protease inhibitor I42 family protein [Streptomyces rimosus]